MTFDEFINSFTEKEATQLVARAKRYRWLRERNLDTIETGGVFAGLTPDNVALNLEDLDRAIDQEISTHQNRPTFGQLFGPSDGLTADAASR